MKRGGPIARRTPLAARSTISRRGSHGKAPNPPKARRKAKSRGLKRPSMDADLRTSIYCRAGGLCDRCGVGLDPDAWECHHRKLRSRGGPDTFGNLVALCSGCHHWAHHNVALATDRGFIVPSWMDPDEMPVWRHDRAWWLGPGPVWAAFTIPDPTP
ncbi:HNH endonuclease signature motif containing protein [Nocardioides sp. STR2]|uniref:HNH endonuclease signature motif containing protein n=1 Tax=Nocardioides pini TaxID=2975053 RepID=A0ABT4CED1_9ACTN|nr:HNH endonuclease signature motif containing protein [Nocardioides pini]MCY4726731.1 HNH endonuclease signature motif containing protein [Nocardioides pini]